MYQIRIDCFDETLKGIRTLFEYDFQSKDQVLENVILPYLKEICSFCRRKNR